jgi:hypothetical protein
MKLMNQPQDDFDSTAPLEPVPYYRISPDVHATRHDESELSAPSGRKSSLNDPRQILPSRLYRGTSLWRKFVALLGLGAFSILGGVAITLIVGVMVIVAALTLQAAIS